MAYFIFPILAHGKSYAKPGLDAILLFFVHAPASFLVISVLHEHLLSRARTLLLSMFVSGGFNVCDSRAQSHNNTRERIDYISFSMWRLTSQKKKCTKKSKPKKVDTNRPARISRATSRTKIETFEISSARKCG